MKKSLAIVLAMSFFLEGELCVGKKEPVRTANLETGLKVAKEARQLVEKMLANQESFARQQRKDIARLKRLSARFANFGRIRVGRTTYDIGEVFNVVDLTKLDWQIHALEKARRSFSGHFAIMEMRVWDLSRVVQEWGEGLQSLKTFKPEEGKGEQEEMDLARRGK